MIFLVLEAFVHLAIARLMVLLLPFRVLPRLLGSSPHSHPPDPNPLIPIKRALLAAARRAPWRCQCLEQSIAGKMMLRLRGIPATLYLGVEKRDDTIHAHAWLRCGDTFIAGGDGSTRYSIVSVLG
ncbi:MAG TPA: lasso peptide biosynthesis B2 protein [Thermoanaerobaculia bacterium]|jgi:hypothetical protein